MEIFIVCNNLFENNLTYLDKQDIELKKMTRPLSIEGETLARNLCLNEMFNGVNAIYSSMFASSLGTAKYFADRFGKNVVIEEKLNDCKVGILGNKNLKTIKFMQCHDFDIKLNEGESLNEVGNRINGVISRIILNNVNKVIVFTHKRSLLGFLIKHGVVGYNLDDNLIVEFNDHVVYNESENDVDIIKLSIEHKKIVDIEVVDF